MAEDHPIGFIVELVLYLFDPAYISELLESMLLINLCFTFEIRNDKLNDVYSTLVQ